MSLIDKNRPVAESKFLAAASSVLHDDTVLLKQSNQRTSSDVKKGPQNIRLSRNSIHETRDWRPEIPGMAHIQG
jgi:hypothetical protein